MIVVCNRKDRHDNNKTVDQKFNNVLRNETGTT
jgi:hypothetical protein